MRAHFVCFRAARMLRKANAQQAAFPPGQDTGGQIMQTLALPLCGG